MTKLYTLAGGGNRLFSYLIQSAEDSSQKKLNDFILDNNNETEKYKSCVEFRITFYLSSKLLV